VARDGVEALTAAPANAQAQGRRQSQAQTRRQAQQMQLAVALLSWGVSGRAASSGRQQAWTLVIGAGFLFVVFIGMAVTSLVSAWHGGDWAVFWEHVGEGLLAGHFALVGNTRGTLNALREGSAKLREAVAGGDETLAPLAATLPGPLAGSELIAGPLRAGPLSSYGVASLSQRRIVLVFMAALLGIFLIGFTLAALTSFGSRPGAYTAWPFVIAVTMTCAMAMCFGLIFMFALRRGYYVLADDYGFRYGRGHQQRVVAWSDVRAFFCVTYPPYGKGYPVTVYMLEAGGHLLRWRAPASQDVAQAGSVVVGGWSAREGSLDMFARLIVGRAHVPLRDITAAMERMVVAATPAPSTRRGMFTTLQQVGPKVAAMSQASAPATAPATGLYAPVTFAPATFGEQAPAAPQKKRWRWLPESRAMRVALAVQLVLVLLLAAVGFSLQRYQPRYYGDLLAAVHAQKPLYTSALARNDGLWPERAASADDPAVYRFENGEYVLTGTQEGNTINAPMDVAYTGPIAVEVTAAQVNENTAGRGVGMLLYYSAQPETMVAFLVRPSGTWNLYVYHDPGDSGLTGWTGLASGSSAIRRGVGAANTLLAVTWPGRYVLYVNDQWVGAYDASASATLPTAGQMGVYVDEGPTGGAFTDFTIYPTPAEPQL
jgi:hypothetical protein